MKQMPITVRSRIVYQLSAVYLQILESILPHYNLFFFVKPGCSPGMEEANASIASGLGLDAHIRKFPIDL